MVECLVGNRCRNCAKRFTSHVLQIDFWVILRSFGAAFVAGLLFALLQGLCPLGGFYMLIFVYLIGAFIGNIIFKIAGRKLGAKVAITVAAGLLAGNLCLCFGWQRLYEVTINRLMSQNAISDSTANQSHSVSPTDGQSQSVAVPTGNNNISPKTNSPDALYALAAAQASAGLAPSPISLSLIIFILGTIGPFLGWATPIPGFFRR